ncbi:DUF4132 domain-containing protein [Bacillus sp. NP157]|nr:DUF4132 domain-containing protein [Bacillus sp. NP157]
MSVMEETVATAAPRADWSRPLDAEGAARIDRFAAAVAAGAERLDAEARAREADWCERHPSYVPSPSVPRPRLLAAEVQALKDAVGRWPLQEGPGVAIAARTGRHGGVHWHMKDALVAYAAEPGVSIVDVVRLHELLDLPRTMAILHFPAGLGAAFEVLRERGAVHSLLDVAPACDDVSLGAEYVVPGLVGTGFALRNEFARDWPDEAVVPYLETQVPFLAAMVYRTSDELHMRRTDAISFVYRVPVFDPVLQAVADDLCFASQPIVREHAQGLRATRPGAVALALGGLAHAQPDKRLMAARWLGKLGDADAAVGPLHAALASETLDLQRGAMLDALVALGASIDRYVDRDALAADAKRGLARGVPKDIGFFRYDLLPAVRWEDTGDAVPPDTLRWLMVQALKRRKTEPDAALRYFCAGFDPAGRAAFARFIMEGWIVEDTRTPSHDEALAWADQRVAERKAARPNTPAETLEANHRQAYAAYRRRLPEHTAASKGLFALVGACADGSIAMPLARYMKRYHRPRKTIMPHLLSVLAQVPEAPALQLLLSIGTQTGAPRVQARAAELADALAERQGWTVEELADRSVPTAGFDDDGRQEFSYGPRHVVAELTPGLGIVLRNSDGKVLKAMPAARVDDDAEAVKDAKRSLKVIREMLGQVASLQAARLRASTWTGRDWSCAEWDALIHRHAVLRHLARRIVWAAVGPGGATLPFRPLGDGTLTDADDNAVLLPADARIMVATDALLGEAGVTQWQAHLADYAVQPAWPQLGQPLHAPRADMPDRFCMDDFSGHMVGAWALRSRMSALGFRRLATYGHDTSAHFHKLLPGTHYIVQVRATDHGPDEGDVEVTLVSMSVSRHDGRGHPVGALDVHAMPPALYSYCFELFRTLADDGTGYRDDWRKVTWMEKP